MPEEDGKITKDLDALLKNWIGNDKKVTILDLSGVPTDILHTIIGVLLRILYDALFWSRNLSQGGRHRPLLLVMEEAHLYLNDSFKGIASKTVQRIVKEGRKYGIGAMIVFISMVLVAGMAASVLIQTAGNLENQAMATGQETTTEVSTGIKITDIEGHKTLRWMWYNRSTETPFGVDGYFSFLHRIFKLFFYFYCYLFYIFN